MKTRGMSSSDPAAAGKSGLMGPDRLLGDALDMLSQWEKFDGLRRLDFKTIGKWKFIQLCSDGFRANCIHMAPEREVHVGMRRVRALACEPTSLTNLISGWGRKTPAIRVSSFGASPIAFMAFSAPRRIRARTPSREGNAHRCPQRPSQRRRDHKSEKAGYDGRPCLSRPVHRRGSSRRRHP